MDETSSISAGTRSTTGLVRWFLLTGNRLLVSLLLLLAVGTAFFVVGLLGVATVTTPSRVMWYLNGTVNGLLTLVPISVGVNQIVLTHEFGSMQDLYDRRTEITDFRERVEERTGSTMTSPYASTFFSAILSSISDTAREIQRVRRMESDRVAEDLLSVTDSIAERADRANDELDTNGVSMLRTLFVMLAYDNTYQSYEIRRLQNELSDSDAETAEALQRINELFVELDAARQFLKTVVVERQLARLSRLLVYTGIPAVTIAAVGIFTYRDVAGLTVSHALLVGIAGAIIVTTLVPLAVLGAYVLRVATIARQTATYGPFLPDSDD